MKKVNCKIIENNQLIIKRVIKKKEDLFFYFDMFGGNKHINLEEQYAELLHSHHLSNTQVYQLLCSYFKFGDMHQEKKILTVELSK